MLTTPNNTFSNHYRKKKVEKKSWIDLFYEVGINANAVRTFHETYIGSDITQDKDEVYLYTVCISDLESNTAYDYSVYIRSRDTGKEKYYNGLSFTTNVVADTTPPVISNIKVQTSGSKAVITWTTDEPAIGFVDYGESADYDKTQGEWDYGSYHRIVISGLDKMGYNYRIRSRDPSNNLAETDDLVFFTQGKFALLIGEGGENDRGQDISTAVQNDLKYMTILLQERGYCTYMHYGLSMGGIEEAISSFGQDIKATGSTDNKLFVCFMGHGTPDGMYSVPGDNHDPSWGQIASWLHDAVMDNGNLLYSQLIIVVATCHSKLAEDKFMSLLPEKTIVITSAKEDQSGVTVSRPLLKADFVIFANHFTLYLFGDWKAILAEFSNTVVQVLFGSYIGAIVGIVRASGPLLANAGGTVLKIFFSTLMYWVIYALIWGLICAGDTAIYGGIGASIKDVYNHASVYTILGVGIPFGPFFSSTPSLTYGTSITPETTYL